MHFMGKLDLMAVVKIENQSRRFLFEKYGVLKSPFFKDTAVSRRYQGGIAMSFFYTLNAPI